jgi:hypothetical protein
MCTPQIQQAIAENAMRKQAEEGIAEATVNSGINSIPPAGFDPRMNDPRYADKFGATASSISEMFDPRTGQVIRKVGPPKEMQIVPITKEEFDGPVMHDSIESTHPTLRHMMRKEYAPIPLEQPVRRSPTVGELLGIKPGQYEEVGGPGDFRNLNVPLR